MIVETNRFLKLDYSLVAKLLTSSYLDIHSEIEVFYAAINWLEHSNERSKFAKELLLTVRFPLLSDHVLKYILDNASSFTKSNECVKVLKHILLNKKKHLFENRPSSYYTSRYCNQINYDILITGGFRREWVDRSVKNRKQINDSNFRNIKILSLRKKKSWVYKVVCLKGEVYAFGGTVLDDVEFVFRSVEKYSTFNKTWTKVDDRCYNLEGSCVCVFIDKIFFIGRSSHADGRIGAYNICEQFDTNKRDKWNYVANLIYGIYDAACTVFEGRILVSGGHSDYADNNKLMNTVQSYDVLADVWSLMPDLINGKSNHSMAVVGTKLFVIGSTCEVFDKTFRKFVALKSPKTFNSNTAVSIGNKILIIRQGKSQIVCYDVDKDVWSEEIYQFTEGLRGISPVKVPRTDFVK